MMKSLRGAKWSLANLASVSALAVTLGLGLSSCTQTSEQDAAGQNQPVENAATPDATVQNTTGEVASGPENASTQNARALLKRMSDYLAAQKVISLSYDSVFEVVSKDKQKLQIATSGTVVLNRPDKIRTTRKAGFADTEMVYRREDLVACWARARMPMSRPKCRGRSTL